MKNQENQRVKYHTAVSLHNAEGQILWSRFNAMLVVHTIFLSTIGLVFNKESNFPFHFPKIVFPFLGILLCCLWFKVTKNGFYWIRHWISQARELEATLNGGKNPIIEGNNKKEIRNDVINTEYAAYCIIGIMTFLYLSFLLQLLQNG